MRWVTAGDLDSWADRINARPDFPGHIGDLIKAVAPSIDAFRFPNGDKGQVRGFDGVLEVNGFGTFVPTGTSIWEFGVGADAISKATGDFEKRTKQVSEDEQSNSTFVFVTPRTYDNPQLKLQEFIETWKKAAKWKDVKFIDGPQLEAWFQSAPAVAARFAKFELQRFPACGVRSSAEFWESYRHRFQPPLTEEVLLCDRLKEKERLLASLLETSGRIRYWADSPDEVVAFAVATIRTAKPELRTYLEARTLVIEKQAAIDEMLGRKGLVFLSRDEASQTGGALAADNPVLFPYGRDLPHQDCVVLPRPSNSSMGKALETMGFDETNTYELARRCGRSVTILARMHPGGTTSKPQWHDDGSTLIPAMLAGAWLNSSQPDIEVVARLSGTLTYPQYEGELRKFLRYQDPPIERVDDVWTVRAPVDAFTYLGHLINTDHLTRFREVVTTVFSTITEPPKPDDIFVPNKLRSHSHSEWIRDGLATTLLLMAALGDQAQFSPTGSTAQEFVNAIVHELPGLSSDYRVIESLAAQLPLLAEAAPDPLLEALEQMLEGNGEAILPIFKETEGLIGSDAKYPSLLWALEKICWDPAYLIRASLLLAKLAAIDPGGKLQNRPISSLRSIFLTWAPSTNAPLHNRNIALTNILVEEPNVGWELLCELLPRFHDTTSNTPQPLYRDSGASEREVLTYKLVWDSQDFVIRNAITRAGEDPKRVSKLLDAMGQMTEPQLQLLLGLVSEILDRHDSIAADLWTTLKHDVDRHKKFATAEWALSESAMALVNKVLLDGQPDNWVDRSRWLFNEWFIDTAYDSGVSERIEDQRKEAVNAIFDEFGVSGLVKLAELVEHPELLGGSIADNVDRSVIPGLIVDGLRQGKKGTIMAGSIVHKCARKFGTDWQVEISAFAKAAQIDIDGLANILLNMVDGPSAWAIAEELGPDIETTYWRNKRILSGEFDKGDLEFAFGKMLDIGRASSVIASVHHRFALIDNDLLLRTLSQAIAEINSGNADPGGGMLVYGIEEIFTELQKRPDVDTEKLAQLEYGYLPVIGRKNGARTLHDFMVKDPAFYVSVLCDIYRQKDSDPVEITPAMKARANASYQLIASFKTVPGSNDGSINFDTLQGWTKAVLELSRDAGRYQVAEMHIGRLLAHAMADDEIWPPVAVRQLIETLSASDIERGIQLERFNMRGVHTRPVQGGGDPERELAAKYKHWASQTTQWPRTSAMLSRIADTWIGQAEWQDLESEKWKLKS
jgi:hypothetical protein